jgi:hypothetical protein
MDRWAKAKLIDLAAGKGATKQTKDALQRDLDEAIRDFAGPTPSPVEKALAETATLSWFALRLYEVTYVCGSQSEEGLTIKQADFHLRRIDRAHRRLLSTLRTLATIRRLALPALQINLASQQVNQLNAGAFRNGKSRSIIQDSTPRLAR